MKIPQEKNNVAITTEREVKQDRRNSTSSNSPLSPRKHSKRPPSAHENKPHYHQIERKAKDEPAHFGLVPPVSRPAPPVLSQSMQNIAQPIATRPRAVTSNTYPRPLSFHSAHNSVGGYGPPLSTSAWANYQPAPQYTYASSPSYTQNPYPQMAAPTPPPGSDYFGSQATSLPERPGSTRTLSSRFEVPPSRTASGFGMRDHGMRDPLPQERNSSYNTVYHDDAYASASEGALVLKRRESIREPSSRPSRTPSRLSRDYHADQSMPPPPRPILRRPATDHPSEYPSQDPYREMRSERSEGRALVRDPSRRRRTSTHRNSVTYDIPDDRDEHQEQESSRTRNRRSNSHRNSGAYNDIITDMGRMSIETANNGRRRASYYGQSTAQSGHTASTGSSGYEDKMREAAGYQDDVGGPSIPLTAEVLKRQQRRQAGSSRSTKSSASRDESDYRKSVTTRTTRSGSGDNDENVTIKVTGTARVVVGGAHIECPEGGEIEIKRQRSIRNGSERSNSEYGGVPIRGQQQIDDRRSRVDQPTTNRARQSSQHSYTRSTQYFGDNYF